MDFEVVNLEERMVAGAIIRISNNDCNMAEAIGGLWKSFFGDGIYRSIVNKLNNKSIGLYTNYESDASGAYDLMTCCEIIKTTSLPIGMHQQIIPAGRYAKFIVYGDIKTVVADFWSKLWAMKLDRKYSCDFEEYQTGSEIDQAEIHIYISLQ